MASGNQTSNAKLQRAQRLRSVLGLPRPSGSWAFEECSIPWYEFPAGPGRHATSAQPVVCLHSIGSGSREFRPLIDRLPSGSRLLLFDWPGHGRSSDPASTGANAGFTVQQSAALLQTILHRLEIARPILLGCGFGAAVALHYAATHPVLGLILCQPSGLIPPQPARSRFKAVPGGLMSPARRQALRIEAVQPALRSAGEQAELSLHTLESSLHSTLAALACPILFALSRQSRRYPLKNYLNLLDPALACAPQHLFTIFSGSFHPLWDEPERFAQAVTAFIQARLPLDQHRHAWLLTAIDWPARGMNLWKCVHPECNAEQILPEGRNANDAIPSQATPSE